jgi:hypothetical protein
MTVDEQSIRYLSDADGRPEAAVVPIELWREIESDFETRRILENPAMVEHLQQSAASTERIPLSEAMRRLGIFEKELMESDDEVG